MPLSPLFLPEGMLLSCSTCLNPTPPSPIRLYQSLTPFSQPPKVKNSQPLQNSCWSARAKSVSNPKQGPSSSLGAALPFSTAQRHYFLDCVNVVAQPYFQLGLTRREVFLKAKGSSWQIGQHFSAGMYTYACLLCLFPQVTLYTSLIFFFFLVFTTQKFCLSFQTHNISTFLSRVPLYISGLRAFVYIPLWPIFILISSSIRA